MTGTTLEDVLQGWMESHGMGEECYRAKEWQWMSYRDEGNGTSESTIGMALENMLQG